MNKFITKISVISLIGISIAGASNQCFAGSESVGLYPLSISNSHKSKESKELIKLQEDQGFINLLKIDNENDRKKIKYDYIFGLFLEFGEGKISIDELDSEVKNRVSICKNSEKKEIKKDEDKVEKLLAETTRGVWEKYEKAISVGKKRLENKEISIGNLQKDYRELAITWFSSQYGIKSEKKVRNLSDTDYTNNKISG